jgi:MioC protein
MHFDIIVGSVLGASEYVAEAVLASLKEAGHDGKCHFEPNISELNKANVLLICTSTHGAGDLPDNIEKYAKELKQQNLSDVNALVIGLGDSSYDTFCGAAMKMESLIVEQNARLLAEPLHIDVLTHPIPEDTAVEWLKEQLPKIMDKLSAP